MEIWVTLERGKWITSPDPATVPRGTNITWRFRSNSIAANAVRWSVLFASGSPFGSPEFQLSVTTEQEKDGQHTGATDPQPASDPGDYKYSVRAEDAKEKKEIGQDDPRLIVLG